MVREALHRSALPPTIAVDFFKNTLIEIAEQLAEKYNLPKPEPSAVPGVAQLIPLRDWPCHPDHYKLMKKTMNGVNQVIINSDTSLEIFKAEMEKNWCITLMHHEPPLTMPRKESHDMLIIRSAEHVFHVLTTANPAFARKVVNALQVFYNANGVIYARSPQGLLKILHDEYSWKPQICDIQPYVNEKTGKSNASFADIPRLICDNAAYCWRGRTFSANTRPSRTALRHRDMYISTIHKFAIEHIAIHYHSSITASHDDDEAAAVAAEFQKAQAEKEAKEQRLAEEKKKREEEILEKQRVLYEQVRQLEQQRRNLDDEYGATGGSRHSESEGSRRKGEFDATGSSCIADAEVSIEDSQPSHPLSTTQDSRQIDSSETPRGEPNRKESRDEQVQRKSSRDSSRHDESRRDESRRDESRGDESFKARDTSRHSRKGESSKDRSKSPERDRHERGRAPDRYSPVLIVDPSSSRHRTPTSPSRGHGDGRPSSFHTPSRARDRHYGTEPYPSRRRK